MERNEIPRKKIFLHNSQNNYKQNDLSVLQKSYFLTLFLTFSAATFCSELFSLPRNGRNGIPRVCFNFCFTEWNFEFFSLLWNGSERNSESLLLFLFYGIDFRVIFSSVERFGTEFREFSVSQKTRNSVGNNHWFRLFHLPQNYFFVGNSQPSFLYMRRNDNYFTV
jgi:hypothetical protein